MLFTAAAQFAEFGEQSMIFADDKMRIDAKDHVLKLAIVAMATCRLSVLVAANEPLAGLKRLRFLIIDELGRTLNHELNTIFFGDRMRITACRVLAIAVAEVVLTELNLNMAKLVISH